VKVFVLNGPNLNLLGARDPEHYGTSTLTGIQARCDELGAELGWEIDFRQTNDEGELIGWIHQARQQASGLVINPAALSHYSMAVADALSALECPIIEVHLSNIFAREEWRHTSVVSPVATGVIAGLGADGYLLAMQALAKLLNATPQPE